MTSATGDSLPPLETALPMDEQDPAAEKVPANFMMVVPRSDTDTPSSWWSSLRYMHGWERYAELEQHLREIVARLDAPIVSRPRNEPSTYPVMDWTGKEWLRVEDKRKISLLGSEAVQHVRSALDHLVYNAGWKNSGSRPKRTQFPILTDKTKWNTERRNSLRSLSPQHVEWIEAVQPYNGTRWTKDLRLLSNMDKHKFAIEISPSVQVRIDHGATFPDPDDDSRVLLQVEAVTVKALLVEDTLRREATTVLPDMFVGAAKLINHFLAEDGQPLITLDSAGIA